MAPVANLDALSGACRDAMGLCADNSRAVPGRPYSALEHAWDQAFGYFGATRRYGRWPRGET